MKSSGGGYVMVGVILLALVLAGLERVAVPVNLVLVLVLVMALYWPFSRVFFLSLVAGVIADLMAVRLLGASSLVFLSLSLVVVLYRRRFAVWHWMVVLVGGGVASWLYGRLVMGTWSVLQGVAEVGLLLVVWVTLKKMGGVQREVYLKLE